MAPTNSRSQEHSNAPSLSDTLPTMQPVAMLKSIDTTTLQATALGH
jgi:hypothetical protein